jgi:hypothetical protein
MCLFIFFFPALIVLLILTTSVLTLTSGPTLADAYIYQRPAKQYPRSRKAAVTAHLDRGECAVKTAAVDEAYEGP